MEVIPDTDLKSFLEKVGTGYAWLLELYELINPGGDDNASNASENESNKKNVPLRPKIEPNIPIMTEYYRGEKSRFFFNELSSNTRPHLEKITFRRTFTSDSDNPYILKNRHRNGLGFHSLATELLSFLMLYNKKILTPQNIYETLKYQPCTNEKELDLVCSNFWINFATSFLYVNFFNILLLLVCLDKMKEDYIEGKALRGVNPLIDVKTFIKTEDLYHFLEIYDYYDSSGKDLITPEFFASVKDRLFEYMEIMGVIEQNIWPLMDMNINTSYVNFILCTSFFNEQFSVTSGALAESTPSHIAGIKVIFDKYIEEIMGYAMDHFKDFSNLNQIKNSFFYHWRTLLSCAIKDQNHMINEFFDDKLHTRLYGVFNQLNLNFQKFWEASRDPRERKKLEDKIKTTVTSCKHLGLLAINIPCNNQNRYTQIKLLSQIEEIQKEYVEFLKKTKHH